MWYMKADDRSLLEILSASNAQYVIPVYQRSYSWTKKQCGELWEDIKLSSELNHSHFLGSILAIPQGIRTEDGSDLERHLIIDGQQRLTTLTLILQNFYEYLSEHPEYCQSIGMTLSKFRTKYLYDDGYFDTDRYRLVLSATDADTLFSIIDVSPRPGNTSHLLEDNYYYFRDKMRSNDFNPRRFWNGIKNLHVIYTELIPGKDNPQLIFESMNSKGLDLTPIDLARNYILMSLPTQEQNDLYNNYWRHVEALFGTETEDFNRFLWYWLSLKLTPQQPKKTEVYKYFKHYVDTEYGERHRDDLLRDILRNAEHYARLFLGKETDKDLRAAFQRIASLKVAPSRPLMLAIYDSYDRGNLPKADFLSICILIESYLFRGIICGTKTAGLNRFFASMYKKLLDNCTDITDYINMTLSMPSAHFPTDDEFSTALQERDCYAKFANVCSYMLHRIENHRHPNETIGDGYQIEHIMPQSITKSSEWQNMLGEQWPQIHEQYCNRLGNLTLTGYNQKYSNRPFEEKRDMPDFGFSHSPLFLNRDIGGQMQWGVDAIKRRGERLSQEALQIWPHPEIDEQLRQSLQSGRQTKRKWSIEENHPYLANGGPAHALFQALRTRIADEFPQWEEYVTRYYIGYRKGKHGLIRIEGQQSGELAIGLPKPIEELDDPERLCVDKRSVTDGKPSGWLGGAKTYLKVSDGNQLDAVMRLVKQV